MANSEQRASGEPDSNGKSEEKHHHIRGRGTIRDLMLGLSDGVVTNVAFLSGFSGAIENLHVIRLAGAAAMMAGAISMFFGGLVAARSENDLFRADAKRESEEINLEPEEEKQELKTFYMEKGLTEQESDIVLKRITSNKAKWLEDLLMHELHIHQEKRERPIRVASIIGLSFLIGAFVPLLGFLVSNDRFFAIVVSALMSLFFLFITGSVKGRISGRRFWAAGFEMLLIGGCAAALLYLIGSFTAFV
ncbi:MAG: VIT1/CCC1 transporter family protein [Nitrososphaerota archaeon]|nr:VIT1/CCC1 transporter family protein [Nitrososphaerota archaeon]